MSKRWRTYEEMLPWLRKYIADNGYGPSLREVAAWLGSDSTSHASKALKRLESEGFIKRHKVGGRYVSRAMVIRQIPVMQEGFNGH